MLFEARVEFLIDLAEFVKSISQGTKFEDIKNQARAEIRKGLAIHWH
jgi:hypothetical protein